PGRVGDAGGDPGQHGGRIEPFVLCLQRHRRRPARQQRGVVGGGLADPAGHRVNGTGARGGEAGSAATDHAAGHARAGVSGGLAGVVVRGRVHDHRAADAVVGRATAEHHALRVHVDLGHTLGIGDDVVHVAGVVGRGADLAVRLAGGVEVAAGAARVGRAAITLLVDVDRVGAAGGQAADL